MCVCIYIKVNISMYSAAPSLYLKLTGQMGICINILCEGILLLSDDEQLSHGRNTLGGLPLPDVG